MIVALKGHINHEGIVFLGTNGEETINLISRICFWRPSLKSDSILNSAKKKMMDFHLITAC